MSQLTRLRFPSIPEFALYLATVVAEVPVIFARMLLTLAVAAIVLLIKGESPGDAEGLMELALIPTGWSILALITPFGGGWWWGQNMGGRHPSERERSAYHDALQLLGHHVTERVRNPASVIAASSVGSAARCDGSRARSPSVVYGATAMSAAPVRRYTACAPARMMLTPWGARAVRASSRTRRAST
jgi:hypothetical protein